MRLSTRAEYGLRICFLLALSNETNSLSNLAKKTGLSAKYLEQILRMLKNSGIISSSRGSSGGYYLIKDSSELSVNEILNALNDSFEFTNCIKGDCDDIYCPNRNFFLKLSHDIQDILNSTTLKDLIDSNHCKQTN